MQELKKQGMSFAKDYECNFTIFNAMKVYLSVLEFHVYVSQDV
jgi:hypothetical protein